MAPSPQAEIAKDIIDVCKHEEIEMLLKGDRDAIKNKCDETIEWLNDHQEAELNEFQDKQKEVERFYVSTVMSYANVSFFF